MEFEQITGRAKKATQVWGFIEVITIKLTGKSIFFHEREMVPFYKR